jgi:hypothetical protein
MDKQIPRRWKKLIGKNFALFFGSSEEPVSYSQIKPLIKEVYVAFRIISMRSRSFCIRAICKRQGIPHWNTFEYLHGISPVEKKVSYKSIFIFTLEDGLITDGHGWKKTWLR